MTIVATVGLNPLPVFIAATALLRQNRDARLVLLCASDSRPMAEAIKKMIPGNECEVLGLDMTNMREVRSNVRQIQAQSGDEIHLHYTGGFKLAGLAAFAELERSCAHSYLDPQDFSFVCSTKLQLEKPDLNLTVEEMARLHGWNAEKPARSGQSKEGKWLEDCAHEALRIAFPELGEGGILPARHFKLSGTNRMLEIDAAVVRGWQLVNVSCCTSSRRIEIKAFEAIYRARQLGGTAAKAAVLACVSPEEGERIAQEVRDNTDVTGDALKVFGLGACDRGNLAGTIASLLKPMLEPELSKKKCTPTNARINPDSPHLIVATVGKNPLPVLVSLQHLLEEKPHAGLVLLCTPESEQEPERILKQLERRMGRRGEWRSICADSPEAAGRIVEKLADDNSRSLTFNCTGGKKSFAFHAFKAFPEPFYCYLDPKSRKLMPGDSSGDLGKKYQFDLESLAALHEIEVLETICADPEKQTELEKVKQEIEQLGHWFFPPTKFKRRSTPGTFRFDGGCIAGFQLVVFQFDRSQRAATIKLNAIKTVTRARQLGGDLAAVLYFAREPEGGEPKLSEIEKDLGDLIGADIQSVRLQPWNHGTNFQHQIREFLEKALG